MYRFSILVIIFFGTSMPIAHAAVKLDCEPWAQDCPSDMACFPTPEETYDCFPSDGIQTGGACDSNMETWESLPCEDGAICLQITDDPSDGQCLAFCTADVPCEGAVECVIPVFSDVPDLGVCPPPCTDQDADGACADVDCDDMDPASFPGAEEICDDGRDNDCDGDLDALDDACGGDDPDAGVDGGDAETDADATTDAGADATTDPPTKKKDSFACRAAGGLSTDSLPTTGWLFALALMLPALRRRRNRRNY